MRSGLKSGLAKVLKAVIRPSLRARLLTGLVVIALMSGGVGLWGVVGLLGGSVQKSQGSLHWHWGAPTASLLIGLGLCLFGASLGLVILAVLSIGRPLAEVEHSAGALIRGELQRPLPVSPTATAEIRELQLVFEEMRRALITKLRSSTELNLQLESEVARRSTELSQRNVELQEALEHLRTTRDELLRTEKLAAVGRIAARVTDAIHAPVSAVASIVQSLRAPLFATCNEEALKKPLRPAVIARIREMDDQLERLLRDALRVRDIVRAMRVYARPQTGAASAEGAKDLPKDLAKALAQDLSQDPSKDHPKDHFKDPEALPDLADLRKNHKLFDF